MRWSLDGVEYTGSPDEAARFHTLLRAGGGQEHQRSDVADLRVQGGIGDFLAKMCRPDPNGEVQARTLYLAYSQWCGPLGVKPETENAFGRALTGMGYKMRRTSAGNLRLGLALNPNSRSRHVAALASIYEWALGQRHRFESGDRTRRQDCLGLWTGGDDWQVLAVLPSALKSQLKALGHDVDTTIRLWAKMGWLILGEQGRPDAKVKVTEFSGPSRPRMVHIRREAIDSTGVLATTGTR